MVKRTRYFEKDFVDNYTCSWTTDNPRFKDLTGQVNGQFTVLKMHKRVNPHNFWFVECTCGNIQSITSNDWVTGRDSCTSCSFSKMGQNKSIPVKDRVAKVKALHPELILINAYSGKAKDQWLWYCPVCETPFRHKIERVEKEEPTCRCGKKFMRWDQGIRTRQILDICKERGLKFLGWKDTYVDNTSRVFLKCPKHPHYEISVNNLTNSSAEYGCRFCGKEKPSREKHGKEKLIEDGTKLFKGKFTYEEYEYVCSRTPSSIFCTKCEDYFTASYDNHINKKRGCPYEKGRNQKQGYIFLVSEDGVPKCCKAGIATDYTERLKRQSKQSVYDVTLINVWEFPTPVLCKKAESQVKSSLPRRVLTKGEYPDGFDETYNLNDIDSIINIYQSNGGIKV